MAGTPMRARLTSIVIDCHDPELLGRFWGALLDRPVDHRRGPYVWFDMGDGVTFGLQRVDEPKRTKNRMHIDIEVDDVDAAVQRIGELGGARVRGFEDGGFLVMADPEGNEFCVVPSAPWHMDEHGRADYLDR